MSHEKGDGDGVDGGLPDDGQQILEGVSFGMLVLGRCEEEPDGEGCDIHGHENEDLNRWAFLRESERHEGNAVVTGIIEHGGELKGFPGGRRDFGKFGDGAAKEEHCGDDQ